MEFTTFVRKPFQVKAIQVTAENIEELSEFIGTIRLNDDETKYIHVDRRLIPNVDRVFVGYWMTKMGRNIRCYSDKVFEDQFVELTDTVQGWVDFVENQPTVAEFLEDDVIVGEIVDDDIEPVSLAEPVATHNVFENTVEPENPLA